jgi:hypothetical protein
VSQTSFSECHGKFKLATVLWSSQDSQTATKRSSMHAPDIQHVTDCYS